MRSLLDVNVLIALHDPQHIHHQRAASWFAENADLGWASCPLTQNGCLRIMSLPGYTNPQPLSALVAMLKQSTNTAFHQFWSDDLSLLDGDRFHHSHMHSPRQLTDIYLLGLAVRNKGRLVTFDIRIPLSTVRGAHENQLVAL